MKTIDSYITTLATATVCVISTLLLTGCIAAALIPLAIPAGQAVSGSQDNSIEITIDEKTFTPSVRDALFAARHWAAVSDHVSDAKAWEYFETQAGVRVSLERPTVNVDAMMTSERRELLNKMCVSHKSDLAVLATTGAQKAGNLWAGVFTARVKINGTGTMHVLACQGRIPHSFDFSYALDSGMFNGDQFQIDAAMRKAFFDKLTLAMGISAQTLASRASQTASMPTTTESKDAGTTKPTGTEPKPTTTKPRTSKATPKVKSVDATEGKKP